MRISFALLAVLFLSPLAPSAHADSVTLSFSGTGVTGTIDLITTPDSNTPGTQDITSVTGQVNGFAVTGFPIGSYNPNSYSDTPALFTIGANYYFFTYDDLLYSSAPILDNGGLLFQFDGTYGDIYSVGNTLYFLDTQTYEANVNSDGSALRISETITPTPEPSSLMLLGTGALAAAGAGRRRFLARN